MDWKRTSQMLSLVAAGIGGVALLGWILEIDLLKRIHPALVTMKANTAVCLILAGAAIWLRRDEKPDAAKLLLSSVFVVAIAVIGALSFCEHLLGIDFGIDQLLFQESREEAGQSFPGRMGPASGLNFVLLGVALLMLDLRTRRGGWPAQWCVLIATVNTFLIFLAYFYGLGKHGPLALYASIALHTVLAFLSLFAAVLLARPERGVATVLLGNHMGAVAARRMLPAALVAPVLLGWVRILGQNAGWYDTAMGTALFATAMVLILTAMIWQTARDLERVGAARYQLSAIVESSEDAILSKDLNGVVTSWNAGAERLFGYSAAEMIGQSITRIIPPDRQDEETMILKRLRAGERIEHYETVRARKDGRLVDVSLTISPVRDATGKPIGASKIARDITERKRVEAEAAHERQWLAVTLSSIGDAVIATDASGTVKFLNPVAESMTGFSSSESIGKPLSQVFTIVNEKTRAPAPNPVERVLREGTIVGLANHTALISRDGRETSIEDSAAPIKDDQGNPLGAVMVFHDVTERRKAEQELSLARDAAEAANRAKDEFLAALSHELRTPLSPVLMLATEMEHAEDIPAALRADFATIRQNVELEARLIDDLLDLTRITKGKLALRFAQVDSHKLLRHALEILRNDIQAKEIKVSLDLTAEAHQVTADAVRLQQVFWNVLKNSVKFNDREGRIDIKSWNENDRLRIAVTDTGLGITADELPRIFDAFAQGTDASEPRFGGLGLGLSISSLLVGEHGGRIWAESPGRNRGATLHVELPLAPVVTPVDSIGATTKPKGNRAVRILLVEDHVPTRETLARLLTRRGHHVESAGSIAQALMIANAGSVDLIISDLGLPDGSGTDLMQSLRQTCRLPAIALSGYGMQTDIEESKAAGFDEHFTKPVDVFHLEQVIQSLVIK